MKALIAYPLSWTLYILGHSVCLLMEKFDFLYHFYPLYHHLILASCDIEDWAGVSFMWRVPE